MQPEAPLTESSVTDIEIGLLETTIVPLKFCPLTVVVLDTFSIAYDCPTFKLTE